MDQRRWREWRKKSKEDASTQEVDEGRKEGFQITRREWDIYTYWALTSLLNSYKNREEPKGEHKEKGTKNQPRESWGGSSMDNLFFFFLFLPSSLWFLPTSRSPCNCDRGLQFIQASTSYNWRLDSLETTRSQHMVHSLSSIATSSWNLNQSIDSHSRTLYGATRLVGDDYKNCWRWWSSFSNTISMICLHKLHTASKVIKWQVMVPKEPINAWRVKEHAQLLRPTEQLLPSPRNNELQ